MKLNPIKANMTELNLGNVSVLFSYKTPVAGWDDKGAFRTSQFYSVTTSKHINQYLGGKEVGREVSPQYIEELVGS